VNIQLRYTDLGHGIIHLDAEYLQPGIASVYLLIENGECAIIETGTCHTVPFILKTLTEFGLNANSVRYVIPTHVHLDHAGGVGLLMQECPNAQLIVHPFGARHMINPTKLEAGAKSVYGEEAFQRLYGELIPVDATRVIEAPDNFEIKLSNRTLRFYDTPGHAKHHFCVHDLNSNNIFSGDTFGIAYPPANIDSEPFIFVTTTPVQFDPDALLNSINRLVDINAEAFNLTHFGQIKPSKSVIGQLKTSIDAFVTISMESRDISENRVEVIDQKIQQYLLNKYHELGGTESDEDFLGIVAMDSKLNAQGLDFWLSKQA
jgi:glyoxylase-like metal-dependent hydrolase (beta-lactamase superfamily II)